MLTVTLVKRFDGLWYAYFAKQELCHRATRDGARKIAKMVMGSLGYNISQYLIV